MHAACYSMSCLLAALSWFLASGVAWIPRTSMLEDVFVFSYFESLFFHIRREVIVCFFLSFSVESLCVSLKKHCAAPLSVTGLRDQAQAYQLTVHRVCLLPYLELAGSSLERPD